MSFRRRPPTITPCSRVSSASCLGSSSPLDWDKNKQGDFVERVLNAFKTRLGGDVSLKSAHESLMRQHQMTEVALGNYKTQRQAVMDALEHHGLDKEAGLPETVAFIHELSRKHALYQPAAIPASKQEEGSLFDGPDIAHMAVHGKGEVHIHLHIM